ncbi:unnamed protein product [Trifolium pratense]|uniref:Uncharacterized protein n=1 Tax=Trifolium pratense TaxID=57577 RepID=A0ACB0KY36_TRIPR|nr:unnamed protein product [Trifolium pratense]
MDKNCVGWDKLILSNLVMCSVLSVLLEGRIQELSGVALVAFVFLRREESFWTRARRKARDSRSSSSFLRIQILQDFVVFDVESSVKLRSDCDTGKGFILYIKSII